MSTTLMGRGESVSSAVPLLATSRSWSLTFCLVLLVLVGLPVAARARVPDGAGPIVASIDTCGGQGIGVPCPELWLLDPRNRSVRETHTCDPGCDGEAPVYSAATRQIAFSLGGELAVADAAGNHTRVIFRPRNFGLAQLAWSPDGRRLLMLMDGGPAETPDGWIYMVDVNTGRVARWRQIGVSRDGGPSVSWSQTGRIAWTNGNGTIYLTNRSGHRPHVLVRKAPRSGPEGEVFSLGGVLFSPGGHTLAFDGCTQRASVCLVSVDRPHARIRALGHRCGPGPIAWRPDSRKLLCIGDQLPWLIDAQTGQEQVFHPFTSILSQNGGTLHGAIALTSAVTWEAR